MAARWPDAVHAAAGDDAAMARWRLALATLGSGLAVDRLDDHQVIAQLEGLDATVAGTVAVGRLYRLVAHAAPAPAPAPAAASSAPRRAAAAAPAAAAVDPGALRPDLDAPAMAQTLRDAARDGVPFCEECARAADGGGA